nr:hypothetical protein [Tanacetum cinerariifolium]
LQPAATLLALGGASWARLGSDGAWLPLLEERGVPVAPLQAANCGFEGSATVEIDLLPGKSLTDVQKALSKPRGARSMSKHLHSQLGIDGVKAALLRELAPAEAFADPARLAQAVKLLPLTL